MRVCIGDALNSYGGSQTARTSIWLITYKISIGLCSRVSFRVVSAWGLTVYIIAKDPNCLSVQGLLCDNERRITKTRKTGPIRKWDNQVMRARRSRIKSLSPQHSTLSFCVYFVSAITADGKWLAENDNVNSNEIFTTLNRGRQDATKVFNVYNIRMETKLWNDGLSSDRLPFPV